MSATCHPTFEHLRSRTLSALNITVSEYRHRRTDARHIHLAADNDENVFLVALRTVPQDSTGVAHILEHTVLCGSEQYPVRDPFFMMVRRSLNTFMNAFTSSDWTAFPFASQNRKDFDNLLSVYLDAVFFSRLHPLDFAQEGHRLDFAEPGNTDSPLVFKGVVYNEMKGAMSSVTSQLWQSLNKYLYPTTTYHHNSGGDPQTIPDLSYQQLQQFYRTHYHPGNAIFMTFGNIPAAEHQARFEQQALGRFQKLEQTIAVTPEKRYLAPLRVEEAYPCQPEPGQDATNKAHIVIGWLLDPSIDLIANLEANLLSSLLFDNSASPLQHLLETTELGASPSPLCGVNDGHYEMTFACGLADTQSQHTQALEQAVLATLQTVVDEGLPQEQIEASLHQLELHQREIGGDGYPYGLQLILNTLSTATHRGDILAFMDLDAALAHLRDAIQSRDYIPRLIQRLLLDNPHRVTLTLRPDGEFHQRQAAEEVQRLAAVKASLGEADKAAIVEQATALEARQQLQDDDGVLPKVTLTDIPQTLHYPEGKQNLLGHYPLHAYRAGTNGLCYQQLICRLPAISPQLLQALPWYTLAQTEVGLGDNDYLRVQQRQSAVVGTINSFYTLRGHTDDPRKLYAYTTLTANALNRNQQAMSELMRDTFEQVRFDESSRLLDLLTQTRIAREQSLTGSGHVYAMKAAAVNCSPMARLSHQLSGLAAIQTIRQAEQQLRQGDDHSLRAQLDAIHQQLLKSEKHWLAISNDEDMDGFLQTIEHCWRAQAQQPGNTAPFAPEALTYRPVNQAWIGNSQVHFCARVYPTVPMNHPDAAALHVLAGVLRNGYLHRAIREQGGAYGGGAIQDNDGACFKFYSYRDPRLGETLRDFDQSLRWLHDQPIGDQAIEEAILGIIGSLDKPGSPAGEVKREFHARLAGRTREKREAYRAKVIQVKADDLRRVAATYLLADKASTAVVTGSHGLEEARALGLEIERL